MDNETRADARVVKTVRRLRSTKPDQCQSGSMTAKNNENQNIINQKKHLNNNGSTDDLSMLRRSKTKIVSSDSRSAKTTNDTLIPNNTKNNKPMPFHSLAIEIYNDYVITGAQNMWYAQVGNAVPVKLAKAIGDGIMKFIK